MTMLKYILPLFLCILVSCNENVVEKPKNLIPRDKMAAILYDISLLNAARSINESILTEHHMEPMDYIYNKYKIDSLQLVKSDAYYASLPVVYEVIYTQIKERLDKEQELMETERMEMSNKPKEDLKKEPVKDTLP
ncbi:MAG TPA: DUF4296 domain-containing protein [Arenibacter sp.]|nr:DUF4296 domain-containing protein [Arenibacter sp.]